MCPIDPRGDPQGAQKSLSGAANGVGREWGWVGWSLNAEERGANQIMFSSQGNVMAHQMRRTELRIEALNQGLPTGLQSSLPLGGDEHLSARKAARPPSLR